jgi:hypothetical protein
MACAGGEADAQCPERKREQLMNNVEVKAATVAISECMAGGDATFMQPAKGTLSVSLLPPKDGAQKMVKLHWTKSKGEELNAGEMGLEVGLEELHFAVRKLFDLVQDA